MSIFFRPSTIRILAILDTLSDANLLIHCSSGFLAASPLRVRLEVSADPHPSWSLGSHYRACAVSVSVS